MKRAIIRGPREVSLTEVPVPEQARDSVIVAVGACGLCTWEQRIYRGATELYPFAGGHEVGGVVVSAPPHQVESGAIVAVSRLPRCGRCPACLMGMDNLCVYLSGANKGSDGPGGLCEYLQCAPRDVVALAPNRTVVEAALVEPLACVLNSLSVAGVGAGTRLAIIGNGFMGVLHARAAQASGASATLLATDPPPIGLDGAWGGPTRDIEQEREELSSRKVMIREWEFDAAIVIRSVPENLTLAGQLVRPGGVVSIFASQDPQRDITIPSQILRNKQLSLTAAASHRHQDFHSAARLVSEDAVQVADLAHRLFTLERVGEALEYASEHDSGRVVVTMTNGA